MSILTVSDIDIATRAAENFIRLYYRAHDSDNIETRNADVSKLYRPNSALTWRGNAFEGVDGVTSLLQGMPVTTHEIQSFDCHPILDDKPSDQAPLLNLIVSGLVTYGKGPEGNPPNTPPRTVDGHPCVFSQTFLLAPERSGPEAKAKTGEVAHYYIIASAFRIVG